MRVLPFLFVRELIYRSPSNYIYESIPESIKVIDLNLNNLNSIIIPSDIYDYCIFRIKKHYKGVGLVDSGTEELIGYGFYSNTVAPPTNIPKLPKKCGWLFNTLILEKYRGNGYQKLLISERIKRLRNINSDVIIYTDILEENYSSRKSFLKSNFRECGVYYVLVLGIRRFRYFSLKIGYWRKSEGHKKIEK